MFKFMYGAMFGAGWIDGSWVIMSIATLACAGDFAIDAVFASRARAKQ